MPLDAAEEEKDPLSAQFQYHLTLANALASAYQKDARFKDKDFTHLSC